MRLIKVLIIVLLTLNLLNGVIVSFVIEDYNIGIALLFGIFLGIPAPAVIFLILWHKFHKKFNAYHNFVRDLSQYSDCTCGGVKCYDENGEHNGFCTACKVAELRSKW